MVQFKLRYLPVVGTLFFLYRLLSQSVIDAPPPSPSLTGTTMVATTVSSSTTTNIWLDIISVGSIYQKHLQEAQKATFGSHPAVRHFYAATELDDSERDCHSNLTMEHVEQIVRFCKSPRRRKRFPVILQRILILGYISVEAIQGRKTGIGWFCAIKRPVDAFRNVAQKYAYVVNKNASTNLPDFLYLGDDDSWLNLDLVVPFLQQQYSSGPHVVAGCLLGVHGMNFTFGFGGFGYFINKPALYNLLRPIHCPNDLLLDQQTYKVAPWQNDNNNEREFEDAACWRIAQNSVGEKHLFRNGMSVADLMSAYKDAAPYLQISKWDGVGFCMHGDWIWGYFLNFYPIAPPSYTRKGDESKLPKPWPWPWPWPWHIDMLQDRLEGYHGSQHYYLKEPTYETLAKLGQCRHSEYPFDKPPQSSGDAFCPPDAHVCHKISPTRMHQLNDFITRIRTKNTTNTLPQGSSPTKEKKNKHRYKKE